jgi:hypothetical protein
MSNPHHDGHDNIWREGNTAKHPTGRTDKKYKQNNEHKQKNKKTSKKTSKKTNKHARIVLVRNPRRLGIDHPLFVHRRVVREQTRQEIQCHGKHRIKPSKAVMLVPVAWAAGWRFFHFRGVVFISAKHRPPKDCDDSLQRGGAKQLIPGWSLGGALNVREADELTDHHATRPLGVWDPIEQRLKT